MTDLSKVFYCLLHDLLIAKLHAYNFEIDSPRLPDGYLVEIYSTWQEIRFVVPQRSVLGPPLFNIHMCNLFFCC